jgi:apoptosis-inducing factor 3
MLISDMSKLELSTAADLKIKFGTNIRTGVVSAFFFGRRGFFLASVWHAHVQTATAISFSAQTVTINGGFGEHTKDVEEIGYDYLVLASGSNPRRLPVIDDQGEKENVFTLRGVKDTKRIDESKK